MHGHSKFRVLKKNSDKGIYPRAWGHPTAPQEVLVKPRTWSRGRPNSKVIDFAAHTFARMSVEHRRAKPPAWFIGCYTNKHKNFRRKFKSLSYWERLLVSFVRFEWILYQVDHPPGSIAAPNRGIRSRITIFGDFGPMRFKNLPAELRSACRRIQNRIPLLPSFRKGKHDPPYADSDNSDIGIPRFREDESDSDWY